jgi:hypothetical protein
MTQTYNYDWWLFNKEILKDFNWFLRKVNERALIQQGFTKQLAYEPVNRFREQDPGLGWEVEYFHPTITLDDRMRYIGQVISQADMSAFNILSNTIISHFYGARGVHQTITGSNNPNDCFVDFDQLAAGDNEYSMRLRETIDFESKVNKKPIWGTTELHTSIQAAARNYCRIKYDEPERKFHPVDVVEWVASFKENGLSDHLYSCEHMEEAYNELTKLPGIGEYYGFHCGASTSVIPATKYHHDQRFVAPGPGARRTIFRLWPNAPRKLYAEAIYFLREQAENIGLVDGVDFHEQAFNIDGIFKEPQNSLKYYGTEVAACQFGIYLDIRNDPKACERRKVSRIQTKSVSTLEDFLV